jgi:hypothetical protein
MAAITVGPPQWPGHPYGVNRPITPPTNLVDPKGRYREVYILFVAYSQRDWKFNIAGPMPAGLNFSMKPGSKLTAEVYITQIFRVIVNPCTGALSLIKISAPTWGVNSEARTFVSGSSGSSGGSFPLKGTLTGQGGAVAAQLYTHLTNSEASFGRIEFHYSGSGGWTDEDVVTNLNANFFPDSVPNPGPLKQQQLNGKTHIDDNQRNINPPGPPPAAGSPPMIDFEIRSVDR